MNAQHAAPPQRPASDACVQFKNIVTSFGTELVLNRVSFEVKRGEFLCLLGPSGCGKSTSLRLMGDLLPVQQGELLIDGEPPPRSWPKLAYVFQNPRLVGWRTVLENVTLGMELRGLSLSRAAMRRRALDHLALVGLDQDVAKYPAMLSGGERQRVSLARALAVEPQVILMDEPFSALDMKTREYLRDEVIAIWQATHKTVVFVTHDFNEALYLADRIVVFSRKPTVILKTIVLKQPRPRDLERDPSITAVRQEMRRLFEETYGLDELLEEGKG